MDYDEKIIAIFRRELEKQGKRPTHLSKENNPDSTIGGGRMFAIFRSQNRLAFSDFMQICQLLNLQPSEVILEIAPNPDLYDIDPTKIQLLEEALAYAKELTRHKNTNQ